jgi:subtilisin-like proprotein convertase family protein
MKRIKDVFLIISVLIPLIFVGDVLALTDDVIDDFLSTAGLTCGDTSTMPAPKSNANVVWADVDGNGVYDTQVVFTTLSGQAQPTPEDAPSIGKYYSFSPVDQACGSHNRTGTCRNGDRIGLPLWGEGRIVVWFVNILAPGFVWNDPSTWQYKAIPAVLLKTTCAYHDTCSVSSTCNSSLATLNVLAYQERNQVGLVTGKTTQDGIWVEHEFYDAVGIKELYIETDFAESNIDEFLLSMTPITPLPIVTVSAPDSTATEAGPTTGTFRVSRTGSTSESLSVYLGLGGSASHGTDYTTIVSPVTIPAGATFKDIVLYPINDTLVEGNETAILYLLANTAYTLGSPSSATITIQDDDTTPPPPTASARVEIDHTYRGDLVVTVGVGNVNAPSWSTVVSNRAGGSADNLYVDVDISAGATYLPPSSTNIWFLKVTDAASGDVGTIKTFRITSGGQTYTSTNPPVVIPDNQTVYAYIG